MGLQAFAGEKTYTAIDLGVLTEVDLLADEPATPTLATKINPTQTLGKSFLQGSRSRESLRHNITDTGLHSARGRDGSIGRAFTSECAALDRCAVL
jgi:hypothetical protein